MAGPSDISADELKVFMQEAEGLLELLDEDIVRLEQQEESDELLQEIFRAAHTLKGSSGMLGFEAMAHLTHAMEDLLDRVRKKTLAVSPAIIDALLMSLDGLKILCDNIGAEEETPVDVDPIVEALRAAAAGGAAPVAATAATPALAATVASDAALVARAEQAAVEGRTPHLVTVQIRPESDWAAVRCFQILNSLDRAGEVIVSIPSQSDIESEQVGHTLELLFATDRPIEEVVATIEGVEDVQTVTAEPWVAGAEAPAAADAPGTNVVEIDQARKSKAAQESLASAAQKVEGLQTTVRIDVEQLDAMMNMVGELVIDRTRVSQLSKLLGGRFKDDEYVRSLGETATHIEKVVDELHENMMRVRMLPVGLLFSKFPRLVRDLARSMDKNIRLEIEGEDTEIDRSVIEKIKDPLVHLIRNAADHGIETAEERRAAGKPELSILRLVARHEQGQIVISLEDDGHGIDAERVKAKAVERGVISAEKAARMSDEEAVGLIFAPGLSTAAKTTEVSGRGVGMDIVRRDIEALKGHVEVDTELGRGTTFRLRLPLTLATIRGLLVSCGKTTYAIPLNYVQETLRPDPSQLKTVSGRSVLSLRTRNAVMSMIWLDESLGVDADRTAPRDDPYVVVVRAGDGERERPVAIAVDRLIDQQDIVVKSLSGYLGRARGIAGASILGDGQVVLIVDIASLIKASQRAADVADAA
ncbi:MAG: chemotaxis protein CheW [Dehalococcoidia bacterium]